MNKKIELLVGTLSLVAFFAAMILAASGHATLTWCSLIVSTVGMCYVFVNKDIVGWDG